jgi:beta-mannosidase
VMAEADAALDVPARGTASVSIADELTSPGSASRELLIAELGDLRGEWFFAEPRDSALGAAELDVETSPVLGGTLVTVTARTLVRDLTILADKLDPAAVAADGLVTLLPGESTGILIRHEGGLDLERLTAPEVLRSANQLVAR